MQIRDYSKTEEQMQIKPPVMLPISFTNPDNKHSKIYKVECFIDTGFTYSFMDSDFILKYDVDVYYFGAGGLFTTMNEFANIDMNIKGTQIEYGFYIGYN